MSEFDFLVVGAGIYGCTFARLAAERGKKVLLVEKRNHIGGNCYTQNVNGIHVHRYGPHVFHTNDDRIWEFACRFTEFNHYRVYTKVRVGNDLYSFPPNMMTFHQLWGVTTPDEARSRIESDCIPCANPKNVKDYSLATFGRTIYEKFIDGYTRKQWFKDPSEVPVSVIKRIGFRFTWDDRYFEEKYEGVPVNGYDMFFQNMIDHENIKLMLNVDYLANRNELKATKTIYSGRLDELFDFKYGPLDFISLRFEDKYLKGDFQGNAVINYPAIDVPYTRITEHKHFMFSKVDDTIITYEYPVKCDQTNIPFYPVADDKNAVIHGKYREEASKAGIVPGGRLGRHLYHNMDQVMAMAMTDVRKN